MTAIVPAWTGSETTRSTWSVIEPTMLSAMIGMPTERSSSAATLMSPPMIEPARTSSRARGRSDRPDRGRDVALADERDRVDRDQLPAQVVAIRLGHGPQRDLGDLGAATHDDDAL